MELVDKMALIRAVHDEYGKHRALRAIQDSPVVDAVPVIRCEKCEYWGGEGDYRCAFLPTLGSPNTTIYMPPDGFCSFGKRKGEQNA
jgi:hypothetical protein